MSDDYEVGYGKPPRQHQFKPGNQVARGKRRSAAKSLSIGDILRQAMRRRRRVRRGDREIDLPVAEIMIERLVQMAMTGSARELLKIMEMMERFAPDLLEQVNELCVTYVHAPGSTVPLPTGSDAK